MKYKRIMKMATAFAVAGVLALPVSAGAMLRPRSTDSSSTIAAMSMTMEQRRERLAERVAEALRLRKRGFDTAASNIQKRIQSAEKIANRIKAAGGDVTAVMNRLQTATQTLTQARETEAKAVGQFQGVPDAQNRRGAFAQARETARQARGQLDTARTQLREAVREMRQIVRELKASADA